MRKRFALIGLVPFAILAACEDDQSGGGPNLQLDAGQPVIDGSTPPPTPTPTADAGDAGPAPVTVTVTGAKGPEANVPVVFQDAAGSVIATVMTSATGVAAQVVPAGSQVTVVMGTATASHLLTITEVEPGDVLTAADLPTLEPFGVSVSVPDGAPLGNLQANAGRCGGNWSTIPPLTLNIDPSCQFGGNFPVLVTAYDLETNAEIGFTFKKTNQAVPPDGGMPLDVNVTEAWKSALRTHTISVTDVPASNGIYTTFSEVVGGLARPQGTYTSNQGPDTGKAESQHVGHPGFPDFIQTEFEERVYHNDLSVSAVATREASPAGDATTTFKYTDLLPYVDQATLDQTTSDRPSVTWKVEDGKSLDTADGAYVFVRWFVESETPTGGDWAIVTPANRKTVKAPQLPPNLAAFAPPVTDAGVNFESPANVTVVDGAAINGYRDFRKLSTSQAASAALDWSNLGGALIPPLLAPGTLRATAYTRNND
jgi:hypothetical protein